MHYLQICIHALPMHALPKRKEAARHKRATNLDRPQRQEHGLRRLPKVVCIEIAKYPGRGRGVGFGSDHESCSMVYGIPVQRVLHMHMRLVSEQRVLLRKSNSPWRLRSEAPCSGRNFLCDWPENFQNYLDASHVPPLSSFRCILKNFNREIENVILCCFENVIFMLFLGEGTGPGKTGVLLLADLQTPRSSKAADRW